MRNGELPYLIPSLPEKFWCPNPPTRGTKATEMSGRTRRCPNPPTSSTEATTISRRTIFRRRYATILAKIGSQPRVMENGIKSPSLSCGTGAAARDRGLNPTRSRAEHSATSFRSGSEDALSASAIPDEEWRAPVSYPEPSWKKIEKNLNLFLKKTYFSIFFFFQK